MNLNILFLIMLFISSIISISSTNWFGVWMGLELNMLSFIPLLTNNKNILQNESALKYFLVQVIASSSLLVMCLFNNMQMFNLSTFNFINTLIMLPLLLKLGSAPFHLWFVMIMEGINWFQCFMLMTWQKITPIFTLFYLHNSMFSMFSIMSMIVGAIGGMNQTSLKKIMAYSSINHIGWMLISTMLNKKLLIMYFMMYLFMNMFIMINIKNKLNFNQMFNFKYKLHFTLTFLSLMGLPPFLGFIPKWIIIQNMILNNMYMLCFISVMSALLMIYYYMRLIYSNMIMLNIKQKWMNKFEFNNSFKLLNSISLMITVMSLFMFNLFIY